MNRYKVLVSFEVPAKGEEQAIEMVLDALDYSKLTNCEFDIENVSDASDT